MNLPRDSRTSPTGSDSSGRDRSLFSHAVQFYLDENFLLRTICDLMIRALQAGDGSVILATEAHQRGLALKLGLRGIDVAMHARKGTYVTIDAGALLGQSLRHGQADFSDFHRHIRPVLAGVNEASGSKNAHAMVYAELVYLLWQKRDSKAVFALEELWEALAREFAFSLFCGYSILEFTEPGTEDVYQRICDTHSVVIPPDAFPTAESERRISYAAARSYPDTTIHSTAENKRDDTSGKSSRNPEAWRPMYQAALAETDQSALFKRIEVAESMMRERLAQIEGTDAEDIKALMAALSHLRDLKRTKLGFTN